MSSCRFRAAGKAHWLATCIFLGLACTEDSQVSLTGELVADIPGSMAQGRRGYIYLLRV